MFFVVFFGLYSCFHLFALIKLKRALHPNLAAMLAIIAFMLLMIAAPVLVRILERHQMVASARLLAYIGYLWMGLLFFFVTASLLVDTARFAVWASAKLSAGKLSFLQLTARQGFFIPLALSAAILTIGFFDALNIRSERVAIRTDKLPAGTKRFTIAQISDVHLGIIVGKARLAKILEAVQAANPDMLVSTGDLVDGPIADSTEVAQMFRRVSTPYGKYAVTGNHEFYVGLQNALKFTSEAGFTVLRGQSKDVAGILNIAGVDDPTGSYRGQNPTISEKQVLSAIDNNRFTLLLKHRPQKDTDADGLFDLQLSGHTHKGQIFPFSLIVERVYPLMAGLQPIGNQQFLYVSRGSGTWGPPVRFLAPPEVTIIELIRSDPQQPQ